jgi:hypothetical protein
MPQKSVVIPSEASNLSAVFARRNKKKGWIHRFARNDDEKLSPDLELAGMGALQSAKILPSEI